MKRRIFSLLLSGTLICSALPAQAYFKEMLGSAMSWGLNQVRSGVNDTVNQKDQEITEELHGMGTFGRLLMFAGFFCALEFTMERLTKERVGILDILLGGVNALGFSTPFSDKEQRGRAFLGLGDPTKTDAAVQNMKDAYKHAENGINSLINGFEAVTQDTATAQAQTNASTTEPQREPNTLKRVWNALWA